MTWGWASSVFGPSKSKIIRHANEGIEQALANTRREIKGILNYSSQHIDFKSMVVFPREGRVTVESSILLYLNIVSKGRTQKRRFRRSSQVHKSKPSRKWCSKVK